MNYTIGSKYKCRNSLPINEIKINQLELFKSIDLEQFVNNNNKRLTQACKNIRYDLYGELYSELYIYLHDNWHKYCDLPEEEIYYLCIDFLKKQFKWENSAIKKTMDLPKLKKLTIETTD
jgi:hypothetical protein